MTKSHFTVNIYGFCGHSSLQEFAGGDLKSLLPKLDPIDKLRVATWLANGVADIHSVDSLTNADEEVEENSDLAEDDISTGTNGTEIPVSLIHNDINMDNILLGYRNGVEVPLINDFNIAVFRKKDARTGLPCLFRGRFANPQVSLANHHAMLNEFLSLLNTTTSFPDDDKSGCPLNSRHDPRMNFRRAN